MEKTEINRDTVICSLIRNDLGTIDEGSSFIVRNYLFDILLVGIKGYIFFTNKELKKEYCKRFNCKIKII
jgi:hypothetical protein